jgi:hypothetical protein
MVRRCPACSEPLRTERQPHRWLLACDACGRNWDLEGRVELAPQLQGQSSEQPPHQPSEAVLVLHHTPEEFSRWLLRVAPPQATRAGGLLFGVLTVGERPGPLFWERVAKELGLTTEEVQRRAGLRPVLAVNRAGEVDGAEQLAEEERLQVRRAIVRMHKALGEVSPRPGS